MNNTLLTTAWIGGTLVLFLMARMRAQEFRDTPTVGFKLSHNTCYSPP